MTTIKRQRRVQRDGLVTPEAVEAFRAGDWIGLHRALRLKPWQASPLDATTDEPPQGLCDQPGPYRDSWARARSLRLELEAA